jgi:LytS/YehU family sensor histidine kinase
MKAANMRGVIYSQKSDYKKAERHLLLSLDYAIKTGNPAFIWTRYDNLASVYLQTDELRTAIECLEKSRKLKEENGNEKDLSVTLLNLAGLYADMGDIDATEKALKESIHYIRKYNGSNFYPAYYFGLGMLFAIKEKPADALSAYNKCIKSGIAVNNFEIVAKAYANQGNIFLAAREWNKAKNKFTAALKVAKEHRLRGVDLMSSIQLAIIAVEKGNLPYAKELHDYINANIESDDFDVMLKDFAELKSRLSEAEGHYKEALDANKKFLGYYKKEYDKVTNRSIQSLQAKYEAEKKDRALEKAKLLQVQSELKALRAQMDPHFIFNALSSMRKELLEGNVDGADAYLVRFSKLLRLILDTTRTPEIRLSDNIELLHLYIQIEQNRQGNRFDYSIETKGIDPDAVYIPGLILQPLAENAIVHGLYNKKNGQGKLKVSFSKTKDALVIRVRDNGVGRFNGKVKAKPGHTSHAMAIIRETLDLTWKGSNVKNYFTIKDLMTKDNINIGTEVTVLLPLS